MKTKKKAPKEKELFEQFQANYSTGQILIIARKTFAKAFKYFNNVTFLSGYLVKVERLEQ